MITDRIKVNKTYTLRLHLESRKVLEIEVLKGDKRESYFHYHIKEMLGVLSLKPDKQKWHCYIDLK